MEISWFSIYPLRVFHTSISWWSFTVVWITASLFRSPGFFPVFWPISVVRIVSILPLISSSCVFSPKPLEIVPSAPTIIGITVMLHSFFCSLVRSRFLSIFSLFWISLSGIIIIIIIIIIYSLRVFHISFSWGSFTGVWVTASLLKSPGLFSVFWPFSII